MIYHFYWLVFINKNFRCLFLYLKKFVGLEAQKLYLTMRHVLSDTVISSDRSYSTQILKYREVKPNDKVKICLK